MSRLEDLEKANLWQPIETAPKDEPYIELFCPLAAEGDPDGRAGIYIGWWLGHRWESDCGELPTVTHWRRLRPGP